MANSPFKNGFLAATGFITAFVAAGGAFAAWNAAMSSATTGGTLTADNWNAVVDNINDLNTRVAGLVSGGSWSGGSGGIAYTGWNVGIGTSVPAAPIHLKRWNGSAGAILVEGDSSSTGAPKVSFRDTNGGNTDASLAFDKTNGFALAGGNVGIGTTGAPAAKLDVNWTVKATQLNSGKAPHILAYLSQCGGACSSYHVLNSWVNVPSYNYAWTTAINNATDVFTHNNKGLITVSQAGTYRIMLTTIAMPAANVGWVTALCPYINGSITCVGTTAVYDHEYSVAGYWQENTKEFVADLAAGSTVGFGYHTANALTYWAHDGYTAIDVLRVN